MSALVVVERAGTGVTAQDFGRKGFRAIGVPSGGALDASLLAAANHLAGAPEQAAGLEILLAAPTLRVERGSLRVGLAGDLAAVLAQADGSQQNVGSWRGLVLREGDTLSLRLLRGPAYIGFSGGLDLPLVLGGRSTFTRACFGGLHGRALVHGDILVCAEAEGETLAAPPFAHDEGPLRFIPGPQAENFPPETLEIFTTAEWRVGADRDRMGMRLSGPRLSHRRGGANIVSDGATPGAIQVPGDGRPILLAADCQTSGGYAKIGCVIAADLCRAAHFQPGESIRFAAVDLDAAATARRNFREKFAQWRAKIAPAAGKWDADKLWSENLISGATSGD